MLFSLHFPLTPCALRLTSEQLKGEGGERIVEQKGETKVKEVGNVPSAYKSGIMPKHE